MFLIGAVGGFILAAIMRVSSEQGKIADQSYGWLEEINRLRAQKEQLEKNVEALRKEVAGFIAEDMEKSDHLD